MTTIEDIYPSAAVRRVVVVGCSVLVVLLLLWNLPVPGLRRAVRDDLAPVYALTQLEQDWRLFAPDASQTSVFLHLEIVRADGSVERLEFPSGEPWIGTYRAYRWSAYEESVLDDVLLQDDALDYAFHRADDPESIVRIDLVLEESDVSTGDHGPFEPTYERIVVATVTP